MSAFFLSHPKETDLALFAGGEMGPFARWRIERHIETCKECEQTVADFFHLSEELSPLAEIPEVDWASMQRNIQAGLAAAEAESESNRGISGWTWQLGAAAACAVVAVAVWNVRPQAELASAPAAEQALNEIAADKAVAAQSSSAPAETGPAPAQERQLARAEAEPALEKKKESAEPVTMALADRADSAFPTDAAAPPPPAPARATATEADADSLVAEERRARESFRAGGRAAVPAVAALGFAEGVSAKTQPVMFEVTPLPAAGEDMRVGADGWISVRAVSADGAMTITDVYDPQ